VNSNHHLEKLKLRESLTAEIVTDLEQEIDDALAWAPDSLTAKDRKAIRDEVMAQTRTCGDASTSPIVEHQERPSGLPTCPENGKVDAGNSKPAKQAASARPSCAVPSSSDLFGHRSIEGGFRKLEGWLQASGDDGWLQRIVDTFHPNSAELGHALAETERTHQREHHDAVREIQRTRTAPVPALHLDRDRRRGALVSSQQWRNANLKVLRLPDGFEHLSEPAKLEAVLHRVREHYQKTTRKYIGFGHPQVPLRSRLRPQHRSGHRR